MKSPSFWWSALGVSRLQTLISLTLMPIGWIYGFIAERRLSQKSPSVDIPVLCIGNFVAGGAGKTPTAQKLAQYFRDQGLNPFFLTRGYGGSLQGPVLVNKLEHTIVHVGDEALVLSGHGPTVVCAHRFNGARFAQEKGADLIIMDDGFQNPSLKKDLSLIVLDSVRGIGNGLVIPAGPLRARLKAQVPFCDGLLLMGRGKKGIRAVRQCARRGLPIFSACLEQDIASSLKNKPLLAFAGIGHPDKFFDGLKAHGLDVKIQQSFADHYPYSEEDAEKLLQEADDKGLTLVTTFKDHVRLDGGAYRAQLATRSHAIPVHVTFEDFKPLERILAPLLQKAKRYQQKR